METTNVFQPIAVKVYCNGSVIATQKFETNEAFIKATGNSFGGLISWVNRKTSAYGRKGIGCKLEIDNHSIAFLGGSLGKNLLKSIDLEVSEIHGGVAFKDYARVSKAVVGNMAISVQSLKDTETCDKFADGKISDLRNLKSIEAVGVNAEFLASYIDGMQPMQIGNDTEENTEENA